MTTFGSVCSGIEAASVAWHSLGWRAAWLAEIEPFPAAVLAHHYPEVPNLGDMTKLPERIAAGEVDAPDVFCGGTPCQAFSVAGLRKSLDDARGNLSLVFCEIANAIDTARAAQGKPPAIVFWENVPGVLNTKDNAFGCFLGALAGEDAALVAPRGKWADAGCVYGPQRAVAWRVLDAQYFGLAQRRHRVFVVASARNGFDPAAVLFEFDGVRRDTAPSREAGEIAPTIPARSLGGGGLGTDFDRDGGLIAPVAQRITTGTGTGQRYDAETETLLPVVFHPTQDPIHSTDGTTHTMGCGSSGGQASIAVAFSRGVAATLLSNYGKQVDSSDTALGPNVVAFSVSLRGREGGATAELGGEVGSCLRASSGGGDKPHVLAPVFTPEIAGTMKSCKDSGGWSNSVDHAAAGYMLPVAHALRGEGFDASEDGTGRGTPLIPVAEYYSHDYCQDRVYSAEAISPALNCTQSHTFRTAMQVRRLTPVECERLQGFPDGYTAIPWRGKPTAQCPDGPRYKALGNSWAVPVVRWIGQRIAAQMERVL